MKIGIVGDANTGKTSFINCLVFNFFDKNVSISVGPEFGTFKKNEINYELWTIKSNSDKKFYMVCDIFVVLFDLTNKKSFENTVFYIDKLKKMGIDNKKIILVGNKVDLISEKTFISNSDLQFLINFYNLSYYQISLKNNKNVSNLFKYISIIKIEKEIVPYKKKYFFCSII